MKQPLVHVLVINWNGLEHLPECFDSLLANRYPNARFVLIDNASTDGSAEFVRKTYDTDPRVDVIENESNLGWSKGNNVGIRRALEAGAAYVFLLNNDTAVAPDVVERLVEAAEASPETGALAPKMLLYDNPTLLNSLGVECSIIGNGWDRGLGRLDGPKWDEQSAVTGVCGGAAFMRAEALRQAGLLPNDFEIYLDDLDLALRIWNAGYTIRTCPEAVVKHKFSATMGQGKRARRKYYLNTRNRFRLIVRNFPLSQAPRVVGPVALGEIRALARAVLDLKLWRVGSHVRAWCAAARAAPHDLAVRKATRKKGLKGSNDTGGSAQGRQCRFWPLIRTDVLFFGGVELPESGWYAPRRIRGVDYRPISTTATLHVGPGKLRLAFLNCYPHLGCLDIAVYLNGKPLASISEASETEIALEVEEGLLEFRANRIFDADETGEHADFGGWIRVEPAH